MQDSYLLSWYMKKEQIARHVKGCIVVEIYKRFIRNKTAGSSETAVVFHHITQHNIPEDRDLH